MTSDKKYDQPFPRQVLRVTTDFEVGRKAQGGSPKERQSLSDMTGTTGGHNYNFMLYMDHERIDLRWGKKDAGIYSHDVHFDLKYARNHIEFEGRARIGLIGLDPYLILVRLDQKKRHYNETRRAWRSIFSKD